MNEDEVAGELKGNTLRVYWYLLQSPSKSVGPREVQRKLGFSSPALAAYHLEKLVELGLAEKESGEYHLTRVVNVGVLRHFLKIRGFLIPRFVLYASMFVTLFLFFLVYLKEINFYSLFALIFGGLGTGIFLYETIMTWRSKP